MTNHIVIGKMRSGTNGFGELLHLSHPEHTYLKEYFSTIYDIDDPALSVKYVPNRVIKYDIPKKLDLLKNFDKPYVCNIATTQMDNHVFDYVTNTDSVLYVLNRKNLLEHFLAYFLAWTDDSYIKLNFSAKPGSLVVPDKLFDTYTVNYIIHDYWKHKLDAESGLKIEHHFYEDIKFPTSNYHSVYNLPNRMDYISNKQQVMDYLIKLKKTTIHYDNTTVQKAILDTLLWPDTLV